MGDELRIIRLIPRVYFHFLNRYIYLEKFDRFWTSCIPYTYAMMIGNQKANDRFREKKQKFDAIVKKLEQTFNDPENLKMVYFK